MPISTQLAVIVAGPGGYAAAFYAADRGLKVAIIDPEDNPGGVCLYRGCIPSKALLHVAEVIAEAKHAEAFGVSFGGAKIDLGKVRDFKNKVVTQLTGGVGQVAKLRKIEYVRGLASFVDAHTVQVDKTGGGDETVTFEHAIVATGSRPATLPALNQPGPASSGGPAIGARSTACASSWARSRGLRPIALARAMQPLAW